MKQKRYLKFIIMLLCIMSQYSIGDTIDQNEEKNQLLKDWQRAKEYTLEYIEAMPPEKLYSTPVEGIRTFSEQMLHLTAANTFFLSNVTGKTNIYGDRDIVKTENKKDKRTLMEIVSRGYDYVIDAIKDMSMAELAEKMPYANGHYSKEVLIAKAFEHQTHHRGQTTIYLRFAEVTPPPEKLF